MAQNYIQPGEAVDAVAPSGGIVSGAAFALGPAVTGRVVVSLQTAAAGGVIVAATRGVYLLPKTAALVINQGDTVYLDAATGLINKTSASNTKAGWAFKAAAGADAGVQVFLEN